MGKIKEKKGTVTANKRRKECYIKNTWNDVRYENLNRFFFVKSKLRQDRVLSSKLFITIMDM